MRSISLLGLVISLTALGADWPQWRGPERTGISKETGLLQRWPKQGPALAWTFKNAGTGYGGPAVVAGRVYCMGARAGVEYVFALDGDGKELWAAKIAPVFDFKGNNWSKGPNATPSVDGDALYALGSQGELVCVALADGKERWRKNLPRDLGAEINPIGGAPARMGWGFAWSPLVDGDQLICTPGGPQGLVAALDKKTGKVLWRSKEVPDQATYSSPIAATIGGVRQYIQLTQKGVVGVAAKDGVLLWYYRREEAYPDVICPTPICTGNLVYATTGWGGGSDLIRLTPAGEKFKVEAVWSEQEIGNKHGGVLLIDKHIYGYHEDRAWECQELAGGKIRWTSKRNALGPGSAIFADRRIYCVSQKGDIGVAGLLEVSPTSYKEVSRFSLPEASKLRKPQGKVWTHPVIADGRLYVRDQELIFCFKIGIPQQ